MIAGDKPVGHTLIFIEDAPSLAFMDLAEHRSLIRDWVQEIMRRHEASVADIAKKAGVGRNTVYRAISDDDELDTVTSSRTIAAIARAYGEALPESGRSRPGLAEGPEAARVPDAAWNDLQAAAPPDGGIWRVTTRALELAGVLPDDLVKVDFATAPQPGDVVCAQLYDLNRGSAETIFRLYEPPYLTAATIDRRHAKPLLVDGERVLVRGVVVEVLRRRAAAENGKD